jgi:hypothetical protein
MAEGGPKAVPRVNIPFLVLIVPNRFPTFWNVGRWRPWWGCVTCCAVISMRNYVKARSIAYCPCLNVLNRNEEEGRDQRCMMRISWNLDGKAVVVIAIAARLRKRDTGTATIHANQVQLLQVVILQLLGHVWILPHA